MRKLLVSAAVATVAATGVLATATEAAAAQSLVFTVQMSGDQVNDSIEGDPDATGTATITVDLKTEQVCFQIDTTNLATPTEDYYIADGPAGQPTGFIHVIVNVDNWNPDPSTCFMRYNTPRSFKEFWRGVEDDPAAFALQVHNWEYGDGAMRGQLTLAS